MAAQGLAGRTIGITADRRGADQAVMFTRLGAAVLHGPTMSTIKVPDPAALRARTEELVADPPDYLIADTGIGIRTWMECAEDWGLAARLREALAATQIAARGPKVGGALSSAGLPVWWKSPSEQLGPLVAHIVSSSGGLEGRTVAFQLHGDDGSEIVARLEDAGARVITLPVYTWGPPADPTPAIELIGRCSVGTLDAVTFTAGPQIRGMLDLAAGEGLSRGLLAGLNSPRMVVGCIGPVCASVAREAGIERPLVPANWRLGSLVKVVVEALNGA